VMDVRTIGRQEELVFSLSLLAFYPHSFPASPPQ
jgi:hypothetical protein